MCKAIIAMIIIGITVAMILGYITIQQLAIGMGMLLIMFVLIVLIMIMFLLILIILETMIEYLNW